MNPTRDVLQQYIVEVCDVVVLERLKRERNIRADVVDRRCCIFRIRENPPNPLLHALCLFPITLQGTERPHRP